MLTILANSFMIATRTDPWPATRRQRGEGSRIAWTGLPWLRRRRDG